MRGGHSALNKIISSTITQGDETENNSREEAILGCLVKPQVMMILEQKLESPEDTS